MLLSLLNDALASAVLLLMSAVLPPSLVTLAVRYVKVSKFSTSLFPAVKFSSLLLLVLTVLHLFPFNFRPTLAALSSSLFVFDCGWFRVNNRRAMSSAKSRSSRTVVKFHRIPVLSPSTVCRITQSITRSNRNPDMQQPCFTPVTTGKKSVISMSSMTAHWKSS